ncbi:MAG TPA: asparaginase [Blastocatellia bacterium]|nr:asparaginase [Blastocatellia bacterium]
MTESLPKLVEVRRGAIVEARHRGSIVAVEPDGRIVARLGDEALVVSTRSCIKPIQALPLIASGAAEWFDIDSSELAVVCGSHDGEPIHTAKVAGLLAKMGLDEDALLCGAHRPYSEKATAELERQGLPFTQLHNNCSGKHAGMLATAIHLGLPLEDYVSAEHPIQKEIASTFARIAGLGRGFTTAIDGCSAPTFGVPLISLALAFARLANPWSANRTSESRAGLGPNEPAAVKWIVAAMTAHPEMVGGSEKRLDTDLMRVAHGRLISKVGAEAVHTIGVLPDERFPHGLGVAIKIEDGSKRAAAPVIIETLAQLGILARPELDALADYHQPHVFNHRKLRVGEVRAVFDLGIGSRL